MGNEVIVSKGGNIGRVTVNRPKQLNAMNSATRNAIVKAFEQFGSDSEVRVIILAGAGMAYDGGRCHLPDTDYRYD